jgi:hypothetical protein
MILLTGFYNDPSPRRTGEFIECVRRNSGNAHIEQVTVFLEDPTSPTEVQARYPVLKHPKVYLIPNGRRLTFKELFEYANRHLPGIGVIIANGDIYFDETLSLLEDESLSSRILCLSRWEEMPDGTLRHFDAPDSQDAWIFEPPLPVFNSDFFFGKPGCENRLAYEAERAGLIVSNPSRSVRARHLHNSGIRRYSERERLNGPTRPVPASFLGSSNGSQSYKAVAENFPSHRGFRTECMAKARCEEIEAALRPYFDGKIPRGVRHAMLCAIRHRTPGVPRPIDLSLAKVAFQEIMGYTLARLQLGVSTHNNDSRPLVFVPPALENMLFTQVVADHAAPVEIHFMSEGRLFVLASPGWEGYAVAEAFLDAAGWHETVEPLRTKDGTVFIPWSLVGKAGERLIVPTQVILASPELTRLQ